MECKFCKIPMDVTRTGEDEYEADCPKCGWLIN